MHGNSFLLRERGLEEIRMAVEYWPEHVTKRSWERLGELGKEFRFLLIGGWAIYLYTKLHKSKDIDVIVDLETLYSIKEKYQLKKNERLSNYEIVDEGFDIDVYVPYLSKLALPAEELLGMQATKIQGISVVPAEALLVLKQAAFIARKGTTKGTKDVIDIMSLLYYAEVDRNKYLELVKKHRLIGYEQGLLEIVRTFQELKYLGINHQEFVKWKNGFEKKWN